MVVELRVDPDDQKLYTLEGLKEKYAGDFTTAEIEDFWREECTAAPAGEHSPEHGSQRGEAQASGAGAADAASGEPTRMERPEPSRLEKRIDPEDGVSYHFEDFMTKNEGHFEKAEIIDYWFDEMKVDLPDGTKLFVGNLSKETTLEALGERFAAHGELVFCKLYCDSEEVSKGFATLQYESPEAAKRALAAMNGAELGGAKLVVREVLDRDRDVSVFVGAVPKEVTVDELEEAFAVCGEVARCSLFHDSGSEDPRSQARVDFIFPESVQRAVDTFHLKAAFGLSQCLVVTPWREDDCGRRLPGPSVFVAKLPLETTAHRLRELFESAGVVVVTTVIFRNKETHESRGIGKVELGDERGVKTVLAKLHGAELDGSSIVVREFSPAKQADKQYAIFVTGMSPETTSDGLKRFFGEAGELANTWLYPENVAGRFAAKIAFKDAEGFQKALRLNSAKLDGRVLFVREYLPMHQVGAPRPLRGPRAAGAAEFLTHVSGLNRETTAEALKEHLASCGQILDVYLMKNRETGAYHGTAKVTFATQEGMQRAIREMSGTELDGRLITLREFVLKANMQGGRGGDNIAGSGGMPQDRGGTGIFVAGMSLETTEEALRGCFSDFGEVTDAFVMRHRDTGISRGIGRVFFADESAQQKVLAQPHQVELDGRKLIVRPHGVVANPRAPSFPVFVGGLPLAATSEKLQGLFESEFGEVTHTHLFLDREGTARGIAKLDFATAEAQQLALSRQEVVLEGRTLRVREYCGGPNSAKVEFAAEEAYHAQGLRSTGYAVFVAGISPETTEQPLMEHFRQCGEVSQCRFLRGGPGGRKAARVEFRTKKEQDAAIKELNGSSLDSRTLLVREFEQACDPAFQVRETGLPGTRGRAAATADTPGTARNAIFVGGLCLDTTVESLRRHLEDAGQIRDIRLILDRTTGRPNGRAFVEFEDSDGQRLAIDEWDRTELDGSTIFVREFEPRPSGSASSRSAPFTPPRRVREEADAPEAGGFGGGPPAGASPAPSVEEIARAQPAARAADAPERRVDPEDGKAYTYEEFQTRARGEGFSDQEILDYWRYDCEPVKPPAAPPKPSQVDGGPARPAPAQKSEPGASGSLASEAAGEPEKKVDPEDGKVYTYEELHRRARGEGFTDQEILDYWREECLPVKSPAPAAASTSPAPATTAPAPAPADSGRPDGRPAEVEAPNGIEVQRIVEAPLANGFAHASSSSSACGAGALKDMTLKDWIDAMDSSGVRDYLGVLEEHFDSLEQIINLYLRRGAGPNGTNALDDSFFVDVGISKIGQKRVVNKWVAAHT